MINIKSLFVVKWFYVGLFLSPTSVSDKLSTKFSWLRVLNLNNEMANPTEEYGLSIEDDQVGVLRRSDDKFYFWIPILYNKACSGKSGIRFQLLDLEIERADDSRGILT